MTTTGQYLHTTKVEKTNSKIWL